MRLKQFQIWWNAQEWKFLMSSSELQCAKAYLAKLGFQTLFSDSPCLGSSPTSRCVASDVPSWWKWTAVWLSRWSSSCGHSPVVSCERASCRKWAAPLSFLRCRMIWTRSSRVVRAPTPGLVTWLLLVLTVGPWAKPLNSAEPRLPHLQGGRLWKFLHGPVSTEWANPWKKLAYGAWCVVLFQ